MRVRLSEYLLAARTGGWMLSLPILLRMRSLPRLIRRLGHGAAGSTSRARSDAARDAQIVTRVSGMRIFDLPLFPRICLRRSLALYHVLGRMGHPVSIHIGVRKDALELEAHSWVTIEGKALGERDPAERFRAIYSYAASSASS